MPAKQTPTDKQRRKVYIKALDLMLKNPDWCHGEYTKDGNPTALCPLIGDVVFGKDALYPVRKRTPYTQPLMKYSTWADTCTPYGFWFTSREERMEALTKEIKLLSRSWLTKLIDKIKVAVIRDYKK